LPNVRRDLTLQAVGSAPTLMATSPGGGYSIGSGATVVVADFRLSRVGIGNAGSVTIERVTTVGGEEVLGLSNTGDVVVPEEPPLGHVRHGEGGRPTS
jgi:hypothetical protein